MDSPAERLSHGTVTLRRWQAGDAELVFRLVRESLDHLRPWMPWAAGDYSLTDAEEFVDRCETSWTNGSEFNYLVLDDRVPAGSAGLMARIGPGGLEIGYWIHQAHINRGVATAAAAALTEAALDLPGIDRVEIQHDTLNLASEQVPVKLGYLNVGTRPGRFERAPGESGTTRVWRITR